MANDENVSLPKSELTALLEEISKLRADVGEIKNGEGIGSSRILRKITERKVVVRRIDGKVVIGFRNKGSDTKPQFVYEGPDPKDPTKRTWFVDVFCEGQTPNDAIKIGYKEFLDEAERVTCLVKSTKEKEWMVNQGMVKKREIDGYSMVELDFDVPVDIIGKYRTFTVLLPDENREVEVGESYVNI
jgi:hypothetical protein